MNKRIRSEPRASATSRLVGVITALALLVALAAGISALNHGTAHAVHPLAAATGAGLDAWQTPASDPSLPSAHGRFNGETTPVSDEQPATF